MAACRLQRQFPLTYWLPVLRAFACLLLASSLPTAVLPPPPAARVCWVCGWWCVWTAAAIQRYRIDNIRELFGHKIDLKKTKTSQLPRFF